MTARTLSGGCGIRSHAENVGQYARRMVAWIDLIVHAFDQAVLVDEETHAVGISRVGSRACAVCDRDRVIGVAKQWEAELMAAGESGVVFGRIEAHADDADVVFVEVRLMVAKSASFERAARRVSFDEEPDQHFGAAKAFQRKARAVVRGDREIRRLISDFDHLISVVQFNSARSCCSADSHPGSPGAKANAPSNSSIARFTIPLAA